MNRLMWPGMLIAMIAAIVILNGVMIVVATSDTSFAVEKDAYDDDAWERQSQQRSLNRRLGWSIEADARQQEFGNDATGLSFRVNDSSGRPLHGAIVTMTAFHKARPAERFILPLVEATDGRYEVTLPVQHRGVWELQFVVDRGDDRYTQTLERSLGTGAPEDEP